MKIRPYPFVIKNAVTADFLAHVTKLTSENEERFEENGTDGGRKFLVIDFVTPAGDSYLFDVKEDLAKRFQLGNYVVPPKLMDFISYITEGGFIHPHMDPDLRGKRHVRINVLVRQTDGCIPLLDDIPIAVAVGDAWLNLASRCKHATTPVEGPGYRSAISFGFQIDEKRGDELFEVHQQWLAEVRETSR
ncbi:MAG TPA: hypothetical protein VIE67_13870 [Rudaea sp.]|jgi:hypothetical protein|uniref:hypothetical protein n=1 Tax=Rudaea sp. TaxID=2136325 RepID=UPI002F95EB98